MNCYTTCLLACLLVTAWLNDTAVGRKRKVSRLNAQVV